MSFVLPVVALTTLTLATAWLWWLMARRPERWARWVDRENDFWRERGLISPALAEKMKRWEKGAALRLAAAVTTIIGMAGVVLTTVVLVKALRLQHQRLRLPVNPALHWKQPKTEPKKDPKKVPVPVPNPKPHN